MRRIFSGISGAVLCLATSSAFAQSITIQYGTVQSVTTVKEEARHAGGALTGGVIGALVGPRHNRGLRAVVGAGVGAAVQGAATSGTLQQYRVKLVNGGKSIVSTEQNDIREGDCVAVEQGTHANIRRVSSVHCESKTQVPAHHAASAAECDKVKDELVKADSDEEVANAAKKVRILCED